VNAFLARRATEAAVVCCVCFAGNPAAAEEKVLFDFKDSTTLKAWAQYLPDDPKVPGHKEPSVKIELVKDPQAPERLCLKLTYTGGRLPAVATRSPLEDWTPYKTFRAEVTAPRTCVAAFRVVGLDDERHHGWAKLALLRKGRNVVIDQAPAFGQQFGPQVKRGVATQFEILMYAPHDGESLLIHDVRVTTEVPQTATSYHGDHVRMGDPVRPWTKLELFPRVERIRVLGSDTVATSVAEFGKQMTAKWVPPQDRTVAQVEEDFQALHKRLLKDHPWAVAAIFRSGQKGYDPAGPENVYAGWACTGTAAHGPNAIQLEIVNNPNTPSTSERMEVSLRGRPPLLRCDLSRIPRGSTILAAQLLLVRATPLPKDWESRRPYFVAESATAPGRRPKSTSLSTPRTGIGRNSSG